MTLLTCHFGQVWGITCITQGGTGGKPEEEGGQNRIQGSAGTITVNNV